MKTPLLFSLALLGALTLVRAEDPSAAAAAPGTGPNHAQVSDKNLPEHRGMDGTVRSPDGIAKARDEVIYIKNGKVSRVNYELKLSEGITARPNGEVVLSNGQTITLKEGDMVTLDGKLTQAPIGLGSTTPGSASTQPSVEKGDKTKFGNTGVRPENTPAK